MARASSHLLNVNDGIWSQAVKLGGGPVCCKLRALVLLLEALALRMEGLPLLLRAAKPKEFIAVLQCDRKRLQLYQASALKLRA